MTAVAGQVPSDMFDLTGKAVFITGANSGIGLAIAKTFAARGARVMIAARNTEKNARAVEAIEAAGGVAQAVEADISDKAACQEAVDACVDRFGSLDVLVNNAGISIRKMPQEYSLEEWNRVLTTNLTGTFLCSQIAHPIMKRNKGGRIINIASLMAVFGTPLSAPYSASKGGVVQLTKSLATAWADDGIRVNAIIPGFIETELTASLKEQLPHLYDQVVARTPAGRWGRPDDLTGLAVFLASEASAFITGAAIPVDGGYLIRA